MLVISYLELVFLDFWKGGEGQKRNFWTGRNGFGKKLGYGNGEKIKEGKRMKSEEIL